jgi:hypothetical protein
VPRRLERRLEPREPGAPRALAVGGARFVTISAPWRDDALDWRVTGMDGSGAWSAAQAARFRPDAALAADGRLRGR